MPDPKTDNDIISDEIRREVGSGPNPVNDPLDKGGLTYDGLSSRADPDLFTDGLPSDAQVRQRYEERYIQGPHFDQVNDMKVRSLLVDWGVNSGPAIAIQNLQVLLRLPTDGILGPATLAATNAAPPDLVVKGLVAARVKMIGRIVSKNPSQVRFLSGWLARALEWLG